jgi:glycosyltransferase involved in cell wall biosynthesis
MDALHSGDVVGGTEGQVLQLLTHLDRRRFEPHLVVFRSSPYIERAERFPCPVDVLQIGSLAHPRTAARLLKLAAFVRTNRVGIAHVFLNDASIVAPFVCRLAGARVLVSRRDMGFWYTAGTLRALRVSNQFVTRMVANSEAVRQSVHLHEGYPVDRIDVCYNGHDLARFDVQPCPQLRARFGIGDTDPIIGMVANFRPWKRHHDLVQAFAAIRRRHPAAHLLLVGTGDADHCRTAVRALDLERCVHFVGGVADPVPLIRHFNVGVLCSESEGMSNAVIEYMGAGKPTVCTNVGGNTELVRDGESGFLVAPGDIAALAERISSVLMHHELAASMGRKARESAEQFTVGRMADAYMNLYRRLAA